MDQLDVAVRVGSVEDIEVLADLYRSGQRQIAGERGAELDTLFNGRTNISQSFANDLNSGDRRVLVGTVDSVPVGYAVVRKLSPDEHQCIAEVSDLFVLPEARGVGVGARLLTQVQEFASREGCSGLTARALPGDRPTKNFFESLGMVARSIEVYRDLR